MKRRSSRLSGFVNDYIGAYPYNHYPLHSIQTVSNNLFKKNRTNF